MFASCYNIGDFRPAVTSLGAFTSSLGTRETQFTVNWNRSETVISLSVSFPLFPLFVGYVVSFLFWVCDCGYT